MLKARTSIIEIAFTNQDEALTQARKHEKGMIALYMEKDGKVSLWGDTSNGIGEIESNEPNHAETLRQFIRPLIEHTWSVQQQLEHNQQIADMLEYYAKNIQTHVDYMYNALKQQSHGLAAPKPESILYRKSYTIRGKAKGPEQGQRRL